MEVQLKPVTVDEKEILKNLLEKYDLNSRSGINAT